MSFFFQYKSDNIQRLNLTTHEFHAYLELSQQMSIRFFDECIRGTDFFIVSPGDITGQRIV